MNAGRFIAAHQAGQFLVDDFDNLLGGGQAVQHIASNSPLCYSGNKFLDHLVAHVCLQQRKTYLAHALPDVVFR